jgi:hypothetical protein
MLYLQCLTVHEEISDCLFLNTKAKKSFKTSGTTRLMTQRHISDVNLQQQNYQNLVRISHRTNTLAMQIFSKHTITTIIGINYNHLCKKSNIFSLNTG